MIPEAEIKRRMKAGESVIAAWQSSDPRRIGGYLRTWEVVEINRSHPDYLTVYASGLSKKAAHEMIVRQKVTPTQFI